MQLEKIEEIILGLAGEDKYSSLSVDTDRTEDFSLLHKCVYFARETIRLNCYIPSLFKNIALPTNEGRAMYTISETDFDIPIKVRYRNSEGEYELDRVVLKNNIDKTNYSATMPSKYMIFGNTNYTYSKIEIFNASVSTGDYIDIDYIPILSNLTTSTDEDILMKKYSQTIIKLGTAIAFQLFKKDMDNFFKYFKLGSLDFPKISLREISADWYPPIQEKRILPKKGKVPYTTRKKTFGYGIGGYGVDKYGIGEYMYV